MVGCVIPSSAFHSDSPALKAVLFDSSTTIKGCGQSFFNNFNH